MNKTEFFKEYGNCLVKCHQDDKETGDFQLFSPEESDVAFSYQLKGYEIASIYELETGEEIVVLDNDASKGHHKIGYFVLNQNKDD